MKVYKVTNEQIENICNHNGLVACWYDDGANGFAGVVVDENSTIHLKNNEIAEVDEVISE
jgi:hypothetical protein